MRTILLSEKQSHLLQLLEWEFSDADFACLCVESADQAKKIITGEKVDAVVLGLSWPSEEDVQLLCWVKKNHPETPVVLFAGEEELQPKSITHFADAWIEKSSHIDLLIEEVKSLIKPITRSPVMY
ncbi:MAG: hypothetical protein HOE48_14175 [Candidatus Latescibacteria bacterium]|jgi:DNA-binding response OmpR family regulator|nr:hypothetical protein [Candidatus Latescibacterota bacterium]MBT4139062.1 hypothetical protein [Candidatus Latescibacterota bacterium]